MRILNQENDKSINKLLLCLTLSEAQELIDSLKDIVKKPKGNHAHIPSIDFEKEITICVYDENDIDASFSERVKNLISKNK